MDHDNDATPRLGFIGLGDQGAPMARRLVDDGFAMTLWARRAATLEPFATTEAIAADSRSELGAASDVLCVCVVDDEAVDEVLRGPDGALASMSPGAVLIIHSTVHPDTCRRLQADFPHLDVLDAPVSGGGAKASARELLVMVGGAESVVARVLPLLAAFGNPVVHLGELGAGQVAKAINNAAFTAQLALAGDLFDLAESSGLDRSSLATVLGAGSGRSYAAEITAVLNFSLDAIAATAGPLLAKDVAILASLVPDRTSPVLDLADVALARMGIQQPFTQAVGPSE